MQINTVTVIGANGTMGRNISGIFASFGNCKVHMVCRTLEKAIAAKNKAALSVKAEAIERNLIPCDYSSFEKLVSESDLVFDSIVEDMEKKIELNMRIAKAAKSNTIICTGTSGLSIQTLSEVLMPEQRKQYIGLHMFNPPYNLTLCEIIPTKNTSPDVLKALKEYVSIVLHRTVVEVKDYPAFLGNRIGFQFINEAMLYAEKYKDNGGIDYIDAILGQYTGRNMAPLNTSDFVGLDVHKAIVDNIYCNSNDYAHETFRFPQFVSQLIDTGNLGRKTGSGLYKISRKDTGEKQYEVYDIAEQHFRKCVDYKFPYKINMINALKVGNYEKAMSILITNSSFEAKLCLEFLLKYISYSIYSAKLLAGDLHAADDVMATGFGWIPPLSLIDALGGTEIVINLIKKRLGIDFWNSINGDVLYIEIPQSKYDYRKYLKAKS